MEDKPSYEELLAKLADLQEIMRALRNQEVDAVVGTKNILMLRLKETEDELGKQSDYLKQLVKELEAGNKKLQLALDEIKTLRGIVPICSSCKKIRDDKGYWTQVEKYVSQHTQAQFSHGICPDCIKKLYPEIYEVMKTEGKF